MSNNPSTTITTPNSIDAILKRRGAENDRARVEDEAQDELNPLDTYRPFLTRGRAQFAFAVVEANGTEHGFMYPTLRHPKLQFINGEEFLSFTADGIAVVLQGRGLRPVMRAMLRHIMVEIREHDGKLPMQGDIYITRLEVKDTQEPNKSTQPRLVK